jgi:hypothetical protein
MQQIFARGSRKGEEEQDEVGYPISSLYLLIPTANW